MLATPPASFHHSVAPVPGSVRAELRASGFYSPGCPVALSELRVLTASYRDFHGRTHEGPARGQPSTPRGRSPASSGGSTRCASRSATCRSPPSTGRAATARATATSPRSFECRQAVPVAVHGRRPHRLVVDARLRRWPWTSTRARTPTSAAARAGTRRAPLPPPHAPPQGHGRRRGVVRAFGVDRLGLGRLLGRGHEGLHALLVDRALALPGRPANGDRPRSRSVFLEGALPRRAKRVSA